MKQTAKKLLSMALVLVMVLSVLPAMSVTALAAGNESSSTSSDTKDAFGISTPDWTREEKAAAEADLPFGTGYGTWTTLFEKNELFFSMGYDSATRMTGLFDWNGTEGTTITAIRDAIGGFGQSKLTSKSESYKAVATAAMDLEGTGKKEYVANLALNASNNALYLYVTDSSNNKVDATQFVEFKYVKQLSEMEVHQLNGAFSIAAGDFDGDGKDTIVVYIPQTDVSGYTQNDEAPFIAEYFFGHGSDGKWTMVQRPISTVSSNVLTMLCNNITDQITTMKNQPMVDLVAEDVDKDGYDELIVTGSMNDVTNSDCNLGSQLFIYDRTSSGWNRSYWSGKESDRQIRITSDSNRRIVWASSTVGNIMVNTSTTSVDYPEIVTAGFVDKDNGQHINVDGDDKVGVQVVQAKSVKNQKTKNVICEYGVVFNQEFSPNGWTKGGFYESEDVNGLLQVQAYADRGLGQAEAVFISGSVYRINGENKLEEAYKHGDFNSKDDFAPGGRTLTNTTITAVTAGNFDGNDEGREQLICVTTLKQSGKNNAYSRVYCYYAEYDEENKTYTCNSKRSNYLTEHKGNFYVSLAALDTDNDSVIAKLVSVERDYSAPDVLAILESAPYFDEIADSFGNSETTYGKATSSGNGSTNRFGFTLGVSVGYEFESDLIQSGGGFEIAVDNAFNWATAKTTTVEWFTEFRNDSGDNLVVVYRCPVVTYRYVDLNGKELVVEKVGAPATSMITVDEYNEAAEQYGGLDPIDETNANLGDPGDPFSYRSTVDENTMKNAVVFNGAGQGEWDSAGWTQYYGNGSVMQGLTVSEDQEDIFSYDLSVSKNVFVKVGGVTAGTNYGFTYGYENTHISGKSVTKSGALTGQSVSADYDFQWRFAAWNCTLNGSTVPVLGYLVKDMVAPPSPAMGLTAESFTTDSVTLRWSSGIRPARQYRIYRVLDDTDSTHVLVGEVQGDETSFQLTGLKPGESYTYVVCGVDYQIINGTEKAMESVDSASIIVRTQSEDSSVTLALYGSTLEGSTLQSTGTAADIQVQATGEDSGTCAYQWQLLEAGAAGVRHGWLSVDTLAGKTIGTVKGATSSSLTLQNIDESLNSSSLRCVVTVITTAGDVDTYYSPVATLDLSGLDTTTAISVNGTGVTGRGSIAAPYTGMADHTTVTQEPSGSYVYVPATVTDGSGNEYTIYQDADNKAYVGVYDEVSGSGVSRTYCAVTEENGTFTLGAELELSDDRYVVDSEGEYTIPTDFTGSSIFENATTSYYEKQYVVTPGEDVTTLTEYWFNTSDGQYYNRSVTDNVVTFALADPQPDKTIDANGNETLTNADLRIVYYEADGTVILSADGTDGYDHYQVYTVGEGGYTAGASFYRVPGTTLKNGGTAYADSAKLETVTVQKEVLNTVTNPQVGTQLTLSASVNPSSGGTVSFTITNTDTGVVTQITAANGTATWTAPKAGLYRIVATAAATATTKTSSAVCYYRADDPNNIYRLAVNQGGAPVTNISYNGSPVTLELEQRTYDKNTQTFSWVKLDSGVSYKANGGDLDSSTYTPGAAGNYIFSAVVDGKTVATAMLVVNKVPITVTPTWAGVVPASKDAIGLAVTDAQGNPISVSVDDYVTVSCDLYGSNGTISSGTQSGVYTVTLNYVDAKKAEFLSRYSVTLNTGSIYYFSDKIAVHFEAGENGKVSARYIDPSGTEFSFSNDSQVSMDYRLKFVAVPNSGCSVDKWTVTVGSSPVNTTWYTTYGNTLEFNETGMEGLKNQENAQQINVSVSFANNAHKITYNAGEGGSLSATAGNDDLASGASVAHNAAVTFTAAPSTGMMVDKWIVDNADYTWPGTTAFYRENTLTLKNIAADHTVQVLFTNAATTEVSASAVDTNSVPYSAATVTVTDAKGSAITGDALKSVSRSGALTFTAAINNPSSAVVKEWQTSTDGENWTIVARSGGQDSITIYQHDSDKLYVRVVIAVTQTYKLSWKVMEGETAITDTNIANLIASSGNDTLGGNGNSYAANIPVTFTLELDDSYYVVGWTNATQSSTDPKSATMTLTDNTTVTVTVAKKPTISWTDPDGGTISVKGTVNGSADTNVNNGGYVDPNTTITVTATPNSGYVVNTINSTAVNTDKANGSKNKDISVSTSNATVSAAFLAKPTVTINSVTGGTVTVTGTKDGKDNEKITNGGYVDFNTNLTVTLKPDTGHQVAESIRAEYTDGTGNTTDDKYYTISNVQANQTITPAWTALDKHSIIYSVVDTNGEEEGGKNGTLSASASRKDTDPFDVYTFDEVYEGSIVTFTAEPDEDYCVKEWTVEMNGTTTHPMGADDKFVLENISAAANVTVQFTYLGSKVIASAGENGELVSALVGENDVLQSITGDGILLNDGVSVQLTAEPDAGYEVESWLVNGKAVSGESGTTYTYVADGSGARIAVTFRAVKYSVSWSTENGTVQAAGYSGSSASIRGGTSVAFTAVPDDGYVVNSWEVNGTRQNGQSGQTFVWAVPAGADEGTEYRIEAILVGGSYNVTVTDPAHGTISAEPDVTDGVTGGTSVTFTANTGDGYIVVGWTVNDKTTTSRSNTHTVTIKGDTTVTAVVVPEKYEVAYSVNESVGGTISAEGYGASPAAVPYDESVTFTAVPNTGNYYYIQAWQVDGQPVTNDTEGVTISADKTTLTLSNVTSVHTVEAIFAKMTAYSVSYQVIGSGGSLGAAVNCEPLILTPGQSADVWGNSTLVFTASPAVNSMVKEWKINGVVQENLSNTLTIDALKGNILVTVEFEPLVLHSIPNPGMDAGYTISIVSKTPEDYGTDYEIRDRGTVTFTVTPENGKYLTELTVNGTNCLTSTGTNSEPNKLTIRNNSDGSFTITVANVKQDITLAATALEFKTFQEELDTVPQELIDAGKFETVPELQTALRAEVKQIDREVPDSQTALFDIVLKYTADGSTWVEADENHFPAGGITVFIPYSDLGDTDSSYTFTVIHMFTTNMDGHTIGDTERIIPDKGDDGIRFTVTSLSPFAIGWSKYTAPSGGVGGGGGGGGGAMPAETVTIKNSVNGKVTVDNTCAEEGDTVTLTVTPDKGYTLETLTVTDGSGKEVKLTEKDGKYTFTMPASDVTIKATFMEDNSMLNFFVDVPADAYYYDAVLWAAKEGITGGVDETHFAPYATCTRAQAVTFLWRAAGSPAPENSAMHFTDVAEGSYYHDAVLWAVENGITKGTTDTTFSPNAKCTRAQIVTFLYRSVQAQGGGLKGQWMFQNPFTDVSLDSYYGEAVMWAVANGVTGGTTATTFSPNSNCTRAQIVTFLYRSMK